MISKINCISNVKMGFKPSFKGNEENTAITVPKMSKNNGIDILANYSIASINNQKKWDFEELIPETFDIEELEGEKTYTDNGELKSIDVVEDDIKTTYYFDDDITIKKFDNKGNTTRLQRNYKDYDGQERIQIIEFDPETGKETKSSFYTNGILNEKSRTEYLPNGNQRLYYYDNENKNYYISETSENGDIYADLRFDENMLITSASETKHKDIKTTTYDINFYNGAIYKIRKEVERIVPNLLGREKTNVPELKPAPKFEIPENITEIEGEKTFYENGNIATLESGKGSKKIKYEFNLDGKLENISSKNKEIYLEDDYQSITEKENDSKKITEYFSNGDINVKYEKDDIYKELGLSKEGKPSVYREGQIKNEEDETKLTMYFNKKGMLEDVFYW